MRPTLRLVLAGSLSILPACGGGTEPSNPPPPPPPAPVVATVTVSPDSVVLQAGATAPLGAVLKDAQGAVVSGQVDWSSTAPGIVSVSTAGLVTALQVGHSLVVAGSGARRDTATVYVQPASVASPVTQTVGTAGGAIAVPVTAGVSLTLSIPAGALLAPVNFVLTPKSSSVPGSLLAVSLSPGDIEFRKPVTLTLSLGAALSAADAQRLALALGTAGSPATLILPTSSTDNGRTFTTTAVLTGAVAASPAGSRARIRSGATAAVESGDLEIDALLATTAQKIAALRAAAQELEATLQFEAAIRYRLAAAVLLQSTFDDPAAAQAEIEASRAAACQRLELYNGTAATRLGADFRNLWQALRPILSWTGAADGVGVNVTNCPERARLHQVLTELVQGSGQSVGFLQLYTSAMQRATFPQNFEDLANELYSALQARQWGALLGLETAFADVKAQIQLPLAQRLRAAGYDWCDFDHDQTYLGILLGVARDGGMLPLGLAPVERLRQAVDPLADLGYDAQDLAEDIQYCATRVSVLTSSSTGSPLVEEGPLGGLGIPGSVQSTATMAAPPNGTLELDGTLMALFCPSQTFGNDRIAVEFNGRPIRELLQVGPTGAFLRSDPVAFSIAELLTQGQVPATGGGSFAFKLIRRGDRCAGSYLPPGEAADHELLVLQLTYPHVTIAPTSVTLDPGGTATFTATLQHSTQGVSWSVTGGTGVVSGNTLLYTAGSVGGNFSVTARSVADPERRATAAVTINDVCPAPSGLGALVGPKSAAVCPLPPVQITTTGLAPGRVGLAYDQGLVATGGDQQYSWSVSAGSLPPGLSLNGSSGRITGTPTTAGSTTFTVKVQSAGLEATKQLAILVNPAQIQVMVYSGERHITIVNDTRPAWLSVYPLGISSWCFVLNQPSRLPVTGGTTCSAGDYGSWTGTINGSALNAPGTLNTKWPITGTISESAVSFSGTDPGNGSTISFSGVRITP
jgi:hypothetical protein